MRKTILWILGILIIMQIAYAGVTNPLPTELNLYKGETGRFKFQIQTVASNQEIECVYRLAEESPLSVSFDPATIVVPAGTVRDVYGSVTAPRDLDFGTYEEEFCISCKPTQGTAGTSVQIETCDLPIKVNVVEERTRDNMYIPPRPFPFIGKVLIGAGILVLLLIIIYLVIRMIKRKQMLGRKVIRKPLKRAVKKVKKKR
ncbi:hypothetical protein KY342_01820 [Candidatus Woesearchaeota archaeon]|nr:hypothetical protein [Candidatus Woesearchaeota archaeon]